MTDIEIYSDFIKLDSFLKYCGAVGTGDEAKLRIVSGEVTVNGLPCTQRGKKLRPGDRTSCRGSVIEVTAAPTVL